MMNMSQKATDLKQAIDTSLQQLAEAVDEQRASGEMRRYLDLVARFHKYSWGNCWLIAQQRPDASLVGGFHHWKRLGRSVKAGEKAIRILAPCPIEIENKDGDAEERLFFKTACVFDISQTKGKELADYEVPDVQVEAAELLSRLEQIAAGRGITVTYRQLGEGHYGSSKGGQIEIASGHSPGQQAKSLAHEIAHELIHRSPDDSINPDTTRKIRELEAEAVAYVVCRHFGLDVKLRASRYITFWGGDAKALAASFGRISQTAKILIEDVQTIIRVANRQLVVGSRLTTEPPDGQDARQAA